MFRRCYTPPGEVKGPSQLVWEWTGITRPEDRSGAIIGVMRTLALLVVLAASAAVTGAQPQTDLERVLTRAGERVEQFFQRAQTLVGLETVRLQPLTATWAPDGVGRTTESELRLSWTPDADGFASEEVQMLRQLLRVNGRPPRPNDSNNCTAPEQQTQEEQPLALLLPRVRRDYEFKLAGRGRVDERAAVILEYRSLVRPEPKAELIDGREDCISFDFEGGLGGRIWIDEESYDVLRLDQHLIGMIEIPLPREATRWPGTPTRFTLERWDTSIRFKPVTFADPDETLVLPSEMTSLRVTRGAGMPRLRTVVQYTNYRRFLTGGRIVQ